jgi:intracellular multiplication protein IcmJ
VAPPNIIPLILSCKIKRWREHDEDSSSADGEFVGVRRDAIARDKHTCRFCGFQCKPSRTMRKADYYMQVHHWDDDHHNNTLGNLVTACMHCHAVQHIGMWGANGEADLVYLPEVSQVELNHLCRTILVAQRFAELLPNESPSQREDKKAAMSISDTAREIFARFESRTEMARDRWRTSSPADIANVMMQMPPEVYNRRHENLAGLRLLLSGRHALKGETGDVMPMIVDSWLAEGGPYAAFKPKSWTALLKEMPL